MIGQHLFFGKPTLNKVWVTMTNLLLWMRLKRVLDLRFFLFKVEQNYNQIIIEHITPFAFYSLKHLDISTYTKK